MSELPSIGSQENNRNIIIYYPRLWTKQFHESPKRWKVIVAHRRSGKTTATLNHLIRDAIRNNNTKYAYIAPTYKQAKNVAWDVLKQYTDKISGRKYNEAELRVDLLNNSRITLYGADNPDSLRGIGLWGVIFDEYSQQPSNIFSEIIRPALSDHQGYAIWIGTPKGKNEFYRLYEHARKDKNWLGMLLTVDDTGLINQAELEDSRAVMTEDEYQQEWYCSFTAAIKGAYYAEELQKAREEKRITRVQYDNSLPVYTFWDLGISDSMSIGFFQKYKTEIRFIDYYEGSDKGLNSYVKVLQDKGYTYGQHIAPHDIQVREMTTGKTRLEIAQSLGINFDVLPKLGVADGINAGRLMFRRLWIDEEKCKIWLDYIAQYRREWDDAKGMFKDNPLHDFTSHAADMYRYAAIGENMMGGDYGAVLTKEQGYSGRPAIEIKDGYVSEEEMTFEEKEPDDWRYN